MLSKERLDANRRVVMRLFDEVVYGAGDRAALIDELIASDYRPHHHPHVGAHSEGPQAFRELLGPLSTFLGTAPGATVRYISDRGYVVRQELRENGEMVDVLRVEGGQCKEHWAAFRPLGADRVRPAGY